MTPPLDSILARARGALDTLRGELLEDRGKSSHWTGSLSASALSTATAVSALAIVRRSGGEESLGDLIGGGVRFLVAAQNPDGGFGDTDRSHSNIATTMLGTAALRLAGSDLADRPRDQIQEAIQRVTQRAEEYVERAGGIAGLRRRYGKDKTFVIPILTNCALAGMVPWRQVQPLPFEAAAVPQSLYRRVRMPVVSYAIPALVAIGQARFYHAPPRNPLVYALRRGLISRTLAVLQRMQPASGGYLEATPLTSFVLMSLASTGRGDHPVSKQAVRFLRESVLEDGSWPIDTNLATWVTSLSIHALAADPDDDRRWAADDLLEWLLSCQHTEPHPFTGAQPGGWGWTDLGGAVPDGDDTPAALLALAKFVDSPRLTPAARHRIEAAAEAGAHWLLQLQNRDGGWPTFCRGWGRLPFDRSSTDLTAHALRALRSGMLRQLSVRHGVSHGENRRARAVARGIRFLKRNQRRDGSWLPLWFGNQDLPDDLTPAYGTGRALLALSVEDPQEAEAAAEGADHLVRTQNADGGWGGGVSLTRWLAKRSAGGAAGGAAQRAADAGGDASAIAQEMALSPAITSSIEETAVALEGLAAFVIRQERFSSGGRAGPRLACSSEAASAGGGASAYHSAIIRAVAFLCEAVHKEWHHNPWPIGFYFAKLWYHERLYPTIFAAAALGTAMRVLERSPSEILRGCPEGVNRLPR